MKKITTKTWLRIGSIALIPMFVGNLINMVIAVPYWVGEPSESMKFYMGECNNAFVSIMCLLGFLGIAFVFSAIQIATRYSSRMDDLDGAIEEYQTAKKEMEKARNKYTKMLIKEN